MAKEKCDKICSTCSVENRSFCAVQMAMANQELLIGIQNEIKAMKRPTEVLLPPQTITEPTAPGTEEE